jgi:hypothetical protein
MIGTLAAIVFSSPALSSKYAKNRGAGNGIRTHADQKVHGLSRPAHYPLCHPGSFCLIGSPVYFCFLFPNAQNVAVYNSKGEKLQLQITKD